MGAEELLLKEACPCFTGKELSVLLTIGWAKNSGREANEVGQRPMAGHCLQVSALNKLLLARSCNSEASWLRFTLLRFACVGLKFHLCSHNQGGVAQDPRLTCFPGASFHRVSPVRSPRCAHT